MPRHAPRPDVLFLAGFAALAILSGAGPALSAAATPAPALAEPDRVEDPASLALARDRDARAAAAVDGLKLALRPGHLTDPMPDLDRSYGLETLRADYSEMQRKAAGYRATLGSQHPTLAAADQILADLRGQLLDATRRALATAERDAAAARTALAGAERDAAAARSSRAPADVTGSLAPWSAPDAVPASPAASAPARHPTQAAEPTPAGAPGDAAADDAAPAGRRRGSPPWELAAAAASGLLALLCAAWASLQLLRSFRRPPPSRFALQRREPALVPAALVPADADTAAPAADSAPLRPVPAQEHADLADLADLPDLAALAALPLPRPVTAAALFAAMAGDPGGPLAAAAARLRAAALARVAGAAGRRVTLLVTGLGDARDADADLAALALAHAAAVAGGRVAVMEARGAGRLRRSAVPAGARPVIVEAGGAARTLYRIDTPAGLLALLPGDASEAAAARHPGAARLRGLDGFDLVVMVGEDIATLAPGADLVVLAASPSVPEAEVAAAANLCRAAGRPCGGVVIEPPAPAAAGRATGLAPGPVSGMAAVAARRRSAGPPPARRTDRPQLRGTLEPLRHGVG